MLPFGVPARQKLKERIFEFALMHIKPSKQNIPSILAYLNKILS
ncbi:hypothetical protein GAPWKB11_0891 [Gilliamella apicola]|jgi:hypothetical protein|nr:hypothetical protein GAPWKB11_0891 [Gilliamella apicola]